MEILNLTAKQLRQAADIQERIQSLQAQLSEVLSGALAPTRVAAPAAAPHKRILSAAGRAAIVAAAKARWARARGAAGAQPIAAAKPRRQMSAAARARLAALARARWRRAKAAGRTAL